MKSNILKNRTSIKRRVRRPVSKFRTRFLRVETLEDRWLLSASSSYTNSSPVTVDANFATRTVNVSDLPTGSRIQDVDVRVAFTKVDEDNTGFAYPNEIVYRLTSPFGTTVTLVSAGTYANNEIGTVSANVLFDQSASNIVGTVSGGNPVSGTFRPLENLSNFNNHSPFGIWTLHIEDTVRADPLDHSSFTLYLTTNAPPNPPVDINAAPNIVSEGAATGSSVGITARATDPDGDPLAYSLTNSAGGRFAIHSSTGVVSVAHGSLLDGPASHIITVRARDTSGAEAHASFAVQVHNVAPTAKFNGDTIAYGQSAAVSFSDQFDPSKADTAAGFRYAYALDPSDLTSVTYADGSTSDPTGVFAGLAAGEHTVYGRIIDKDNGYTEYPTTIMVNRAELTVVAGDQFKVYGSADPELTYSVQGELFHGDTEDVISGVTLDTDTGANATAGNHVITASGGMADNYNITHIDGTLTVAKAELTVLVDDQTKIYDGNPFVEFTVSYDGFVAGEDSTVLSGLLQFTGDALDAGSYTIQAEGLTSGNYQIGYLPGTLVIHKAAAVIDVLGTTVTYDGTAHGATGSATGVNGEALVGLDLGANFTNVPGGTANWTFTDMTGNYNDTSGSVEIVIAKATATIAVDGKTVTYDGNAHGASGTATGVNNESLAGLDLGASLTDVPGGTANWVFTDVSGNYNNASGSVEVVINKRPVAVTADDQTKVYGDDDPPLTYEVTEGNLVANDNFFGELERQAGEDVGSYAIDQGTLGLSDNYDLSFVESHLTITHRLLIGDASTQDALNLAKQGMLNITVTDLKGFVNGENAEVFLSDASFWITIDDQRYEFVPESVTKLSDSSIAISYRLKNSDLQANEELANALELATSGASAVEAGFAMESTNYSLSDDSLTRLFSTIKK